MGDWSTSHLQGDGAVSDGVVSDGVISDDKLIADIACGDGEAFALLLERHLDSIHSFLYRMTSSHADCEDIAQETFLRVWRKASTYRPGKVKVSTWLHTIAHNLCVDTFRKHREIPIKLVNEAADDLADPARQSSAREQKLLLESALSRLPDNQRSAILLCQVQGFSNAQAAAILGVNRRALESLLARARRRLRGELFENGDDSG